MSSKTKLDTESQAIADAATAHNADLEAGADVTVPTGKEDAPAPKPDNPMDARKAIFRKAKKLRTEEEVVVSEANPSVAHVEQLLKEQIAAADEEAKASGKALEEAEHVEVEGAEPPETVSDPDARVMITVNGAQSDVTQGDIDSAGGVAELQKMLSADQKFREAANLSRKVEQERAELEEAKASFQQEQAAKAALDLPVTDAQGKETDVKAAAEAVTKAFNEGDPEALTKALTDALVNRQVTAPVEEVRLPEAPVLPQKTVPTGKQYGQRYLDKAGTIRIDAMMKTEFSDLMQDVGVRNIAHDYFNRLMADPVNEARRGEDIAREAAKFALQATAPAADPLEARRALKRSTVKTPTASKRHEAPKPKAPDTPSKFVNTLRAARGQPPL